MKWKAVILYYNAPPVEFSFEDWGDFVQWLTVGPDHDWSVVASIVVVPMSS